MALNRHHTGNEEVPLGVKRPKGLQDAAWMMNAGHRKEVEYTVYDDGTFDCRFVHKE